MTEYVQTLAGKRIHLSEGKAVLLCGCRQKHGVQTLLDYPDTGQICVRCIKKLQESFSIEGKED